MTLLAADRSVRSQLRPTHGGRPSSGSGRGWGVGSGVVVAPGQVLTNAHNLRHDEVTVTFADGAARPAAWPARDPDLDIAVIAVDTGERRAGRAGRGRRGALPHRPRGPRAGQPGRTRPAGHARLRLRRPRGASAAPRARRIPGAIEHTAPLPRGSSGGPLLDADGRLLGHQLRPRRRRADPRDPGRRGAARACRGARPRRGAAAGPPRGRDRPARVARRLRSAVGLPRARRRAGPRGRGGQPGRSAPASSAAT